MHAVMGVDFQELHAIGGMGKGAQGVNKQAKGCGFLEG
jgi:hypothetical protein